MGRLGAAGVRAGLFVVRSHEVVQERGVSGISPAVVALGVRLGLAPPGPTPACQLPAPAASLSAQFSTKGHSARLYHITVFVGMMMRAVLLVVLPLCFP